MRPEYNQTNDYRAFYLFIHHFTLIYSCLSIYQLKKSFPWIVLLKVCTLTCSVKNFQGHCRKIPKRDYWGSSYPWMPSSHSSMSMDTSPLPIYIGPALLGLVTIYLVTHHHLGGYFCFSQERNSVWVPTNTPIWIIIHSIQVNFRKDLRCTVWLYIWNLLDSIKWINQILEVSPVLIKKDCSILNLFFVDIVTIS